MEEAWPHLGGCQRAGGDLAKFCNIQPRPHKETSPPWLPRKKTQRDGRSSPRSHRQLGSHGPGTVPAPTAQTCPSRQALCRLWWWQKGLDFRDMEEVESMGLGFEWEMGGWREKEREREGCKVPGLHGAWIMAPLTDLGNKGQRDTRRAATMTWVLVLMGVGGTHGTTQVEMSIWKR